MILDQIPHSIDAVCRSFPGLGAFLHMGTAQVHDAHTDEEEEAESEAGAAQGIPWLRVYHSFKAVSHLLLVANFTAACLISFQRQSSDNDRDILRTHGAVVFALSLITPPMAAHCTWTTWRAGTYFPLVAADSSLEGFELAS